MKIKFKIFNKNLTSSSYTSEREFVVDENLIYTTNYNETLDSCSFRISHLEREIEIEPLDECVIYEDGVNLSNYTDNDFVRYMCVESYTMTQDTLGADNSSFGYTITLCSQTKLLEGFVCPNLSITPYRNESGLTRKTIYQYLLLYNDLYGDKVRVQVGNDVVWRNRWTYSTRARVKFSQILAPEMQWNAPTLREIITDLMMVKDCIPILSNGVIDFIDLTEKKNKIGSYNYIQKSQSLEDYTDDIKMNIQNVLQESTINTKNNAITEFLTFRTTEHLITSENILLKTEFPILRINHLWMYLYSPVASNDAKMTAIDLCDWNGMNFVKEQQEYITLKTSYNIASILSDYDKYQNYCVFYNRGSNVINGFNNLSKNILWSQKQTIELYKEMFYKNYNVEIAGWGSRLALNYGQNSYYSTFFKIEYETSVNQVFSATKYRVGNKRVIVDNQTNSWVDSYTQGNLETQKVNRLGNQSVMYNQRGIEWSDVSKIGDFENDNIIYQAQYQNYTDHIETNLFATKNYILKNYFTGVNSKIRTWVNAKNEAFERHELSKYYVKLGGIKRNETGISDDLVGVVYNSFDNVDDPFRIKYALIQTTDKNDNLLPINATSGYAIKEVLVRIIGNSYVFTTGFEDNYYAGEILDSVGDYKIEVSDINNQVIVTAPDPYDYRYTEPRIKDTATSVLVGGIGGIPTQPIRYADSEGEIKKMEIIYLCDYDNYDGITLLNDANKEFLHRQATKPYTDGIALYKGYSIDATDPEGSETLDGNVKLYQCKNVLVDEINENIGFLKDNKEILKSSLQFELWKDNEEVYGLEFYFTRHLLEHNPILNTDMANFGCNAYVSDEFNYNSNILPNDAVEVGYSVSKSSGNASCEIEFLLSGEYRKKSIYITDENDNVMVAFSGDYPRLVIGGNTFITLNVSITKEKNYNIYDSSDKKQKIGEI